MYLKETEKINKMCQERRLSVSMDTIWYLNDLEMCILFKFTFYTVLLEG